MSTPNIERLTSIGFVKIGEWSANPSTINFLLDKKYSTCKNVLYSFVANETVMYIGKTTQSLKNRINNYKNGTRSTNLKNKDGITNLLKKNIAVSIFVLPDNGLLTYGGFHLNLAAGLEDSLIRDLSPAWNGGKKEAADGSLRPLEPTPQAKRKKDPRS